MRILIVDDFRIILELLETILRRPGVEIDKAENCAEAFRLLAKNTYN